MAGSRGSKSGSLAGRVAIVTGAGRGIGRAIAIGYLQAGAVVIATAARQTAELERLAAQAQGLRGQLDPIQADVTSAADARRVTERALSHRGRIDVLVNNAARGMRFVSERFLSEPQPFWHADPDAWRLIIDTNINGVFMLTREVVSHMLGQDFASIINVSINQDTMVRAGFSPYGPSKAALEAMTHVWARDLDETAVQINLLLPGGATATGMVPDEVEPSVRENLLDPQIMVAPAIYLATTRVHDERIVARTFVET